MKKNFFKKLSFVLALAMIMSTIAPAGAFAATKKPKLNSAKEYLFLGSGNDEQFDFNVKNTVKGYKYKWTSADKAVATVNKSGVVTAKGIGSTKVSVIVKNKKGKQVSTLKASVIVKDNIASLKITGTPAGDKVAVGKENAFTYSYTTKSGSTSQTTSVVAWKVDKAGATITDAGKFVATAAGSYKVTATAYQSKAKLAAGTALCSADYTVTVPNEIKSVTATKLNQLKVTFSSAATAVDKANFTVTNTATTGKLFIKAVTLSDDKTYATVDLYDTLVSGTTYSVAAKVDGTDMKGEVKFVKGAVAKIVAPTSQVAQAGKAYNINYAVYDENGLDVTAATNVYFTNVWNQTITNGVVTLANVGDIQYVNVVYVNPTTGAQISSDKITITAVNAAATDIVGYTLAKSWDDTNTMFNSNKVMTSVALNDDWINNYYVRIQYKDQYGNTAIAPIVESSASAVRFTSLDPSVFVVGEYDGKFNAVAAGTGYFRVKIGNVEVTKSITVKANYYCTALKPENASLAVSDTGNGSLTNEQLDSKLNTAKMKINYFDNSGSQLYNSGRYDLKVEVLDGSNLLTIKPVASVSRPNSWTNTITWGTPVVMTKGNGVSYPIVENTDILIGAASGTQGGTAVLKISGTGNYSSIYTVVTVTVAKADNNQVNYVIDGAKDLDINSYYDGYSWTTNYDTTLKVYSVNAANFKVREITGTAADANIKLRISGPNNKSISSTAEGYYFNPTSDTTFQYGSNTGDYTVEAFNSANGYTMASAKFTVKDTGAKPSIAFTNNSFTGTTLGIADIQSRLSGLDGCTVTGFMFTSSNGSLVATPSSYVTSATIGGTTVLYNVKIQLSKVCYDLYSSTTYTRVYEVTLPSLNVSQY